MIDGNRGTRWSSGAGQSVGMSVTVDLGGPQTFSEIVMDAGISIGDFLRRYTVQVSDDGRTWTDIAIGPGRPSLTGEMVIALPPTTARHLRLVSGATSGSWWSIHELNLRTVTGSADPVRPGAGLVRATGRLPDGTWVGGYYNAGSTAAEVPWPIDGFGYTYRLPPTAAVTFALPGSSPATQRAGPGFHPGAAWARHHPPVTDCARHHQHDSPSRQSVEGADAAAGVPGGRQGEREIRSGCRSEAELAVARSGVAEHSGERRSTGGSNMHANKGDHLIVEGRR